MSHKSSPGTPTKSNNLAFQTNIVTSLGSMQPTLPNIAPAPQHMMQQQQMQHPMAPQTPQSQQQQQIMATMPQQHMGQAMQAGQFQLVQQQYGAAPAGVQPQYAIQQPFATATYNQQGQLVLQPSSFQFPAGMQLTPQPGQQQQYILTAAPSQKPGQPTQMIASLAPQQAQPAAQAKPAMTPISQGYTFTTGNGQLVQATTPSGMHQTFMITGPMGGMAAGMTAAATPQTIATSMGLKPIDQKPPQGSSTPQPLPQSPMGNQQLQTQNGPQQQQQQAPQQIMLNPGMTYMTQQGAQAIFQNGQIIFRPAAPQDPTQSLMFSPTGQHMVQQQQQPQQQQQQQQPQQQPQMHPMQPQQLTTSMAQTQLQQMTIPTSTPMRPPSNSLPMQPPPGKTPISRSLPQILPTTRPYQQQSQMPQMPGLSPQQPSPKSKQKVSPKGNSGSSLGRPPGPNKSQLNSLKVPPMSMSPPRMPGSPGLSSSPQLLGPPILQTSQVNLLPQQPQQNMMYGQPPVLTPQVTSASSDSFKTTSSSSTISSISSHKFSGDKKSEVNGSDHSKTPTATENSSPGKANKANNVLTHIIDGHKIEESSEPFPVDDKEIGELSRIYAVVRVSMH